MEFSKEQKAVLAIDQGNRIVSAQAGAGKTRILVEDILKQLLEKHVGLDQMLIVTFTRKAAGEMKNRISQGLLDALKDSQRAKDRPWIFAQLSNLPSANIQTLDAFCLEIVKTYYDRLGVDPGIHILDQKSLSALHKEVLDQIWQDLSIRAMADPSLRNFLEAYGYRKRFSTDLLWENMQAILRPMYCQPDPELWLREQEEKLLHPDLDAIEEEAFHLLLVQPIAFLLDDCLRVEQLVSRHELPKDLCDQTLNLIHSIRRALTGREETMDSRLLETMSPEAFFPGHPSSIDIDFGTVSRKGLSKFGPEAKTIQQDIKNSRNRWKDQLKEINKNLPFLNRENLAREFQLMAPSFLQFAQIVRTYLREMQGRKQELNGLDFYDCQMLTLKALKSEETRRELQGRFARIYFDEYQDSSRIQDQIIDQLARGDNLFFVGDIKQSIYGFRQAEPENFKQRYRRYQSGHGNYALDMTLNFRTRSEILAFINFIFQDLMTEERGDAHYDSPGHRSQSGRTFEGAGKVQLVLLQKNEEEAVDDYWKDYGDQPFYVARAIEEHIASGGKFSDCAILTRTNQAMIPYEIVLRHLNIPLSVESSISEQDSLDLAIAKALFQLIDNRRNDLALLTILSSMIGGFSDADLARIRMGREEMSYVDAFLDFAGQGRQAEEGSGFAAEMKTEETPISEPVARKSEFQIQTKKSSAIELTEEEVSLQRRAQDFLARIEDWRMRLKEMPLDQFVRQILEETGLLSFAAALPAGRERVLDLDSLIRLAEDYGQRDGACLSGFLTWLDEKEMGEGESFTASNPLSDQDNVVRMMTIHKAKGLEFPLVFLVDCQAQFPDQYKQGMIASDPSLGSAIAIRGFQKGADGEYLWGQQPVLRRLIDKKTENKERSEAVRLLYVAMTRAIDQLFLVGEWKEKEIERLGKAPQLALQEDLSRGKSYLDWILSILRRSPLMAEAARGSLADPFKGGLEGGFSRPLPDDPYLKSFEFLLEKGEVFRDTEALTEEKEERGKEDWQEKMLAYQYPFERESHLPLKKTVSQLSAKNQNKDENLKDWPSFFASRSSQREKSGESPMLGKEEMILPEQKEIGQEKIGQEETGQEKIGQEEIEQEERKIPRFLQKERKFTSSEWGTLMHKAMQLLPLAHYDSSSLSQALDLLQDQGHWTREERKALNEPMLLTFFKTDFGREIVDQRQNVRREQAFTMLYHDGGENYAIDGQIDLYLWTPAGIYLVDFKTDQTIRPDRYRTQLSFYARALEKAYKKPVLQSLIFWLRWGKWTEVYL